MGSRDKVYRMGAAVVLASEGRTLGQIATELGCSRASVCRDLQRAEKALGRRVLQHEPGRPAMMPAISVEWLDKVRARKLVGGEVVSTQ